MVPTESYRLERRVSSRPADLDYQLPPASSLRKRSGKNDREENFRRATIVIEPESCKRKRIEKQLFAQGACERSSPTVSADLTSTGSPLKWMEPRQRQPENSVSQVGQVKYKMQRHPFEVDALTKLERKSRLSLVFRAKV